MIGFEIIMFMSVSVLLNVKKEKINNFFFYINYFLVLLSVSVILEDLVC